VLEKIGAVDIVTVAQENVEPEPLVDAEVRREPVPSSKKNR
jgi:hypothetical protein